MRYVILCVTFPLLYSTLTWRKLARRHRQIHRPTVTSLLMGFCRDTPGEALVVHTLGAIQVLRQGGRGGGGGGDPALRSVTGGRGGGGCWY